MIQTNEADRLEKIRHLRDQIPALERLEAEAHNAGRNQEATRFRERAAALEREARYLEEGGD